MSAVFVEAPGTYMLYCRQNPSGAATTLYLSSAEGGAQAQENQPTFYQDKMNLLVWLDAAGRRHAVKSPEDWRQRREHILANMQFVMGPLSASDQ